MENGRNIAIILARMGSSRLPGKVLIEINGVPLLKRIYNRVKRCKSIDEVYVATSTSEKDNLIEDFCSSNNIPIFRGSEEDVLGRFYSCAESENRTSPLSAVVRITGDAPFVDPVETDKMVNFLIDNDFDYVHNRHLEGPPLGFHAEVIAFKTLQRIHHEVKDKTEREHVTLHILKTENRDKFKIKLFDGPTELRRPNYRLLVDDSKDIEVISKIYQELGENPSMKEVVDYVDKNQELSKKTADIHLDFKNLLDK